MLCWVGTDGCFLWLWFYVNSVVIDLSVWLFRCFVTACVDFDLDALLLVFAGCWLGFLM